MQAGPWDCDGKRNFFENLTKDFQKEQHTDCSVSEGDFIFVTVGHVYGHEPEPGRYGEEGRGGEGCETPQKTVEFAQTQHPGGQSAFHRSTKEQEHTHVQSWNKTSL